MPIFALRLNDMRESKIESTRTVFFAASPEPLSELLERERVAPYMDDIWGKVFRAGGPLEWYNAPLLHGQGVLQVADKETYLARVVQDAEEAWDAEFGQARRL